MPRFDRSGPMGVSPMTGGRRGLCNPANTEYDTQIDGMFGFGREIRRGRGFRDGVGRGMGRAFGRRGWNQPSYYLAYAQSPEEELNMLKSEANSIKKSFDMINRKIAELEKSSE